ncbi:TetR/AcrR family transcriptional regulator [Mycetocola sp. 2940]|uniref:TetR/AcrR family transcriptional regulator n=1 Tax=Mycetocola sp. 2940 TaxID=3156452 RepID=UPI00339548F3
MGDAEAPGGLDAPLAGNAAGRSHYRYAKGAAKRRAILDTALRLIAQQGYQASTLQEIADAVGLTKAGVLHYFDSREALLAEVLRERDDAAQARFSGPPGDSLDLLAAAVTENETTPGLVALYSRLVVDSAAPDHPAHDYIADRYRRTVDAMADAVRDRQSAGTLPSSIDPLVLGRLFTAISDGLQLQWAYDDTVDMREAFDIALAYFEGTAKAEPHVPRTAPTADAPEPSGRVEPS